MATITLPDNISFEEIAAKWCSHNTEWSSNAIDYYAGRWELVYFYSKQDTAFCDSVFTVDMKTRELEEVRGHGEPELAKPLLDFIKERSNV